MLKFFGAIVGTVVLLIIELVVTVLVYTGLNIWDFELFGRLVRLAGGVLDSMLTVVASVFAGGTDTAYASLFGELGPKAMLLLLIGLAVAGVMRLLVMGIKAIAFAD